MAVGATTTPRPPRPRARRRGPGQRRWQPVTVGDPTARPGCTALTDGRGRGAAGPARVALDRRTRCARTRVTRDEGTDDIPPDTKLLLKKAFDAFDREKSGSISTDMVGEILRMLEHPVSDDHLKEIIAEVDADGSGQLEFEEFCDLAARFLIEEDAEAMQQELREAFRLYDKEGNGYISTSVLREILRELDDKVTNEDLDMMIEEIDSDGSGTVDFDEFMEVMTGGD
ncbi:Neurocalcin homolog [Gryllus bimaculatus]|nr:Neurocalcin homolog [Gryllus bimaculatus]